MNTKQHGRWWSWKYMTEQESISRLPQKQMCMGTAPRLDEFIPGGWVRGHQPLCIKCVNDCMILLGDEGTKQSVICFDFSTGNYKGVSHERETAFKG